MLTVHHLGKSQSERIVWLCEELGIPYALKRYNRDPVTKLAPAEYKALHPIGTAPVISDGDVVLAESGAVMDYIIATRGAGRLSIPNGDPGFTDYLYWYHFANVTLQPTIGRVFTLTRADVPNDSPVATSVNERLTRVIGAIDQHLQDKSYLAGETFSAADIMTVFSLTTMRYFASFEISPYPNILSYLQRIAERPAYRRAMEKGDPGMELLLT